MAINNAMIATTTKTSIRVNPDRGPGRPAALRLSTII
jgi:hypothetical protein